MEIKKLDCPSCGASLEWNASSCNFCKTEVRYFENNSSVLPVNLTADDIEKNVVLHEKDFMKAIVSAISSPYSNFKKFKNPNEQNLKNDFFNNQKLSELLKLFYETFFILPDENMIAWHASLIQGQYVLLTSIRVVLFNNDTMNSIPWERIISWKDEKPLFGKKAYSILNDLEYTDQSVLRYILGDKEVNIRFDPADNRLYDQTINSIISCKEWEDLSSFQRNLISVNRYNINKSYKIQVKPLELMEFHKKGCFVATATMGDYNHPTVLTLQNFRDTYLIKKRWGRSFIEWYYQNAPYYANIIGHNKLLKKMSYWFIIQPLLLISKIVKRF